MLFLEYLLSVTHATYDICNERCFEFVLMNKYEICWSDRMLLLSHVFAAAKDSPHPFGHLLVIERTSDALVNGDHQVHQPNESGQQCNDSGGTHQVQSETIVENNRTTN